MLSLKDRNLNIKIKKELERKRKHSFDSNIQPKMVLLGT
jgi:hypothetical protein